MQNTKKQTRSLIDTFNAITDAMGSKKQVLSGFIPWFVENTGETL